MAPHSNRAVPGAYHSYAVSPDGQRFLVTQFAPSAGGEARSVPTLSVVSRLRSIGLPQLKSNRESAASLLAFYMVVNPRQYQVGELNIVFVLHQHVTIAADAELW